jgi:hypothetical protein
MSTIVEIRKQLHAFEFNVINQKLEELSKLVNSLNKRLVLLEQVSGFENAVLDTVTEKTKDEVNVSQQVLETITTTLGSATREIETSVSETSVSETPVSETPVSETTEAVAETVTETVTVDENKKTTKGRKGKAKK